MQRKSTKVFSSIPIRLQESAMSTTSGKEVIIIDTHIIHSKSKEEEEKESESKVEKLLNPWNWYPHLWDKIFLVVCVFGVMIDPFFLYIPTINSEKKCLDIDDKMEYIALALRILTDLFYIVHIVLRFQNARKMAHKLGLSIFTGFPWLHLIINILAILPIPQVILLRYFSSLAGSESLTTRKFMNILLILQYVPRLVRVYISGKELGKGLDSLARHVWVRGTFFFIHYIIFGHISGAFWYFYAIFRETACWHAACRRLDGCEPSRFNCRFQNPIGNMTYLNNFCPVNPPNSTVFDFGIFSDAIESGILQNTVFLEKFFRSFWWGLQNLISFGQSLNTTSNVYENLFAVIISILGLLLFLYLIGNLQTYMQLATTKSEEERRKITVKLPEINSFMLSHKLPAHKKKVVMQYFRQTIKEDKDFDIKRLLALLEEHSEHGYQNNEEFSSWVRKILDAKRHDRNTSEVKAELWIARNGIEEEKKVKIMRYVQLRLIEGKDVDFGNLISILPVELAYSVKKFLCFPFLRKVSMLKNLDDHVYETICKFSKPVMYSEKSYVIRKDEPLDFILFVTQGIIWSFGSKKSPMKRLQKGDVWGEEMLEWRLKTPTTMFSLSYSGIPMSGSNLKCHNKVEGLVLNVVDLEHVLSNCWSKFEMSEGLKPFAAASLQNRFRRYIRNKTAKPKTDQISVVTEK